jgi:PAS domain S-box-containing protein
MRRGGIASFTLLLAVAGIGAGLGAQALARPGAAMHWAEVPLVLALLALASHLVVRVQWRDELEALDLFEAVLAPTIVVFPPLTAVALAFAAKLIVCTLHRTEGVKTRYNAASWAAATGCGALVFAALRSPGAGFTAHEVGALVLAMAAVSAVNCASFTVVVSLATGRGLGAVLAERRTMVLLGWAGASAVNVAFGMLFVSAYLRSPAAIAVMAVPLVVLHWGSRGYATARTDRARLTGLQNATHVLARPIDPREAVPAFLDEVRRCFEADAVDLIEVTASGPVRHRVAGDLPYVAGADDGFSTAGLLHVVARDHALVVDGRRDTAGVLAPEGWRSAAAAPVRHGERSFGVLCVYNRGGAEGFEQGEVAVLEALASELAGALLKAELLDAMLDERRRLADIVGNTSDGILTLDDRGRVTSWNSGLEQITGYAAETMLGRVPDIVLRPRDGTGAEVELAGWTGGGPLPAALEVVTEDRTSRWLSCSYTDVAPRDGRGRQLVVMARDVTRAHELEKLKDDFVAVVSHELRTPLSPIKGWAATLLDRGEDLGADQRREGARAILRQADRLEQLILNILEDSRIESNANTAPVDEVVDVRASVAKVVEDFSVLAPERAITLHCGDAPVMVVGRAVRIEQVLVNLVANAVKYSPRTEPIDVAIEAGPGAVVISVTDRGPGIRPEARERIFERFERLADSPTQTGTGLGLYIARQLATSMGGALDVTSATGGGSTFTLTMKAVRRLAAVV